MEPTRSTAASGHAQRPLRAYRTGAVTRWLRIATVAFSAAVVLAVLVKYPSLPETVPTHFGPTGEADAWGSRASILLLVFINCALVGGMTWLSYRPRWFNYPGEITEENAQRMYRLGEQMLVWVNAGCALLFAGILADIAFGIGTVSLALPAAIGLVVVAVWGLVRMLRAQ